MRRNASCTAVAAITAINGVSVGKYADQKDDAKEEDAETMADDETTEA